MVVRKMCSYKLVRTYYSVQIDAQTMIDEMRLMMGEVPDGAVLDGFWISVEGELMMEFVVEEPIAESHPYLETEARPMGYFQTRTISG